MALTLKILLRKKLMSTCLGQCRVKEDIHKGGMDGEPPLTGIPGLNGNGEEEGELGEAVQKEANRTLVNRRQKKARQLHLGEPPVHGLEHQQEENKLTSKYLVQHIQNLALQLEGDRINAE